MATWSIKKSPGSRLSVVQNSPSDEVDSRPAHPWDMIVTAPCGAILMRNLAVLWCLQLDHIWVLATKFVGRSVKIPKQSMMTAHFWKLNLKSNGRDFCSSSRLGHFTRGWSQTYITFIHLLKYRNTVGWLIPNLYAMSWAPRFKHNVISTTINCWNGGSEVLLLSDTKAQVKSAINREKKRQSGVIFDFAIIIHKELPCQGLLVDGDKWQVFDIHLLNLDITFDHICFVSLNPYTELLKNLYRSCSMQLSNGVQHMAHSKASHFHLPTMLTMSPQLSVYQTHWFFSF